MSDLRLSGHAKHPRTTLKGRLEARPHNHRSAHLNPLGPERAAVPGSLFVRRKGAWHPRGEGPQRTSLRGAPPNSLALRPRDGRGAQARKVLSDEIWMPGTLPAFSRGDAPFSRFRPRSPQRRGSTPPVGCAFGRPRRLPLAWLREPVSDSRPSVRRLRRR